MFVSQKKKKKGVVQVDDDEKKQDSAWVVSDGSDSPPSRRIAKAVDEDLYKISPDLLRAHTKKVVFFFSFYKNLPFY